MRKIIFLLVTLLFLGCKTDVVDNNCFPFININETINLDLPQFIDLQVPGGWAYTSGGIQGIIVYNLNGNQFKAYDRSCPGQNISTCSPMIVDSSLRMVCECSDSEFNILNGAPLTQGITCFAKEYLIENLNGSILRISNF
tara:strand:- start:11074 stop:11496 length:423 start_codon:yes stop_codon:yes gene_type:complete